MQLLHFPKVNVTLRLSRLIMGLQINPKCKSQPLTWAHLLLYQTPLEKDSVLELMSVTLWKDSSTISNGSKKKKKKSLARCSLNLTREYRGKSWDWCMHRRLKYLHHHWNIHLTLMQQQNLHLDNIHKKIWWLMTLSFLIHIRNQVINNFISKPLTNFTPNINLSFISAQCNLSSDCWSWSQMKGSHPSSG